MQSRPTLAFAALLAAGLCAMPAHAQSGIAPITTCDAAGIGTATLVSDLPTLPTTTPPNDTSVQITGITTGTTGGIPYCRVALRVQPAINIVVGLPMAGNWNGRLQSEGGGGYAGSVGTPTGSIGGGYIGVQTDTGHTGGSGTFGCVNNCTGTTQANPGLPDKQLQSDFAYRSEHLMAVLGKQLSQAFYGRLPVYSYWNGCSTGGRQGMRMAQQFPNDYNGILAGAPAFHWDRFQAYQIWPQMVMRLDTGGPISNAKQTLATNRAVAVCGNQYPGFSADNFITDPRTCTYNPALDPTITTASCTSANNTCLTAAEAGAIQKIWQGARNTSNQLLWPGVERGAALNGLGGTNPFAIAVAQPRFWVYFNAQWDWATGPTALSYANYEQFFRDTISRVNPMMASDNPVALKAFRDAGGKILMWQGWADQLIMPQGSTMYYEQVAQYLAGGDYSQIQPWFRHFMAPGVAHCGGGTGPQPQSLFQAVVNWVENGAVPGTPAAPVVSTGAGRTRNLCPYPAVQTYVGGGANPNLASSFVCQ